MLFRTFFMALLCAQLLKAEIFTSVQHMTNAFKVEKKIANALSNYLSVMEQKLERIRRYLNDYEQVEEESKMLQQISASPPGTDSMAENLAGNPLQAFHLMKRLTIDWKHLQEHDPFAEWREVEEAMNNGEVFGFSQFNDEEDLKGTAQAIILLQSIYQLNTSSLVNGNIGGIQTAAELTAQDCLYLGKHSFNLEMYYNSVLWFEQAYVLAGLEKNRTLTQDQVIPFMNKAYEMFDEKPEGDTPIFISNKLANARKELDDASARKFQLGDIYMNGADVFRNYEALCRGEQLLSHEYVAKLKCYYDNRNSPYLMLMPAKTEKVHIDPEILIFHDVISDKEIEDIKLLTNSQLARGLVRGGEDERTPSKPSKERISKIAWLDRAVENYIFKSVGIRLDALTGLSVTHNGSAEQMQVGNYGTGGHYNPHVDYFKKSELSIQEEHEYGYGVGDRMATFMFYLSNVNKGGATAFPITGVSVFPEKGSAVFWFNLRKSGIGDYRSLHGGCPVVHGSKWVANKWIRERNQMLIRSCSLSEKE